MTWQKLCHIDEIPLDGSVGIKIDPQSKDYGFVVKKFDGIFAWRNACPHLGYQGTSMAWKRNHYLNGDKQYIMCAAHGARFEIRTGEGVTSPCQGMYLKPIALKTDESGYVHWLIEQEQSL